MGSKADLAALGKAAPDSGAADTEALDAGPGEVGSCGQVRGVVVRGGPYSPSRMVGDDGDTAEVWILGEEKQLRRPSQYRSQNRGHSSDF